MKRFLVIKYRNRYRLIERVANQKKERVQILEEVELIERDAMAMLHQIGIDRFKLHKYFRRGSEVKAFLLEQIKAMVFQGCRDSLVAMRIGLGLEVDNHSKSTIICQVVVKQQLIFYSSQIINFKEFLCIFLLYIFMHNNR